MAANTVPVVVKLLGETSQFRKAMKGAQWDAASLGQKMRAVGGIMSNVGANITRKATLPIVGLGVAALISADKVDKAYSKISAGTGATGKQLEGLTKSFDRVAGQVPQTFDETAAAIADLNTRLGLTGKPLEKMSRKFLDLSRVTGTDVAQNIREGTRLFGDWSIKTQNQGKALDDLLKTSQMSGIGLNDLMSTVVQFGAPLRNMGFSFAESTAMLAKWEKEGVNTSTVLTGMKFALKTFAKAGEDPQKALEKLIPKIRDMKDEQAAMTIGMQTFGLRAGPDMVAAIREGRFEYADFQQQVEDGTMTVEKAGKGALTFSDKMKGLKNRAMLVGASFGKMLIPYIEKLVGWVEKGVKWFGNLSDGNKKLILTILGIVAAVGPVLLIVGKLITVISMVANPVGLVILGITALVAAFIYLWKRCSWFSNFWKGLWNGIKKVVSWFWGWAGPFIKASVKAWWTIIKTAFKIIVAAFKVAWKVVSAVVKWFWGWAGPYIKANIKAWWAIIKATFNAIVKVVKWAWPHISNIVKTNIAVIKAVIDKLKPVVKVIRNVWNAVRDVTRTVWNKIGDIVGAAYDRIRGFVNKIIGAVNWVIDKVPGINVTRVPNYGGGSASAPSSRSSKSSGSVNTPRIMDNGGMGAPSTGGSGAGGRGGLGGDTAEWVKDLWSQFNISGHLPQSFGGMFGGVSGALLGLIKDAIVGLLKKSGGGVRQRIVNFAKSQIGVPYLWGGTSPAGFDCSGLPYWAYAQAGKSIPRIPTYGGKQISRGQIQPADIMFYYPGAVQGGKRVPFGHFKMYAGNNQTIESASGGVQVRTADWGGAAQIRSYLALGGITRGLSIAGEAGPEAVIPLTKPNRAAKVMAEAGLLGGGGDTYVSVYLDSEQIAAKVEVRQARKARTRKRTLGLATA